MSEGYPNGPHLNKKTIVHTEKIHGCSENSVSEEVLFAVLHSRYIFSLNISAKPTFILRKSKGNSNSHDLSYRVTLKTSESCISIIYDN